jgi:hypothetical protein
VCVLGERFMFVEDVPLPQWPRAEGQISDTSNVRSRLFDADGGALDDRSARPYLPDDLNIDGETQARRRRIVARMPIEITALDHIYLAVRASEPRFYPEYAEDYYATFFEDPDGMRFEIVSFASSAIWCASTGPSSSTSKTRYTRQD